MRCYACGNTHSFWGDNYYTYCSKCDAIMYDSNDGDTILRLRKRLAELQKQSDTAWTIVYKKYTGTAEYKEYDELRRRMRELEKEIDNL